VEYLQAEGEISAMVSRTKLYIVQNKFWELFNSFNEFTGKSNFSH
jgi:hypothetical protein